MLDTFIVLIPSGLLQGSITAFVALGLMLPFRFMHTPDLSSEGSFPLGGILCAVLLSTGLSPFTSTPLAMLASGLMATLVALSFRILRMNALLAGIVISTMVYSINLRLMGKPNVPLFDKSTLFSLMGTQSAVHIACMCILNLLIISILYAFLSTEKGLRLLAVGHNESFALKQGISPLPYILLTFFLSGALCGLGGTLMVQSQRYADVGMGVGIVIHALAALMIGESLMSRHTHRFAQLSAPFAGALIYQQIQGLALSMGCAPGDLKLLTGGIVLTIFTYKRVFINKTSYTTSL